MRLLLFLASLLLAAAPHAQDAASVNWSLTEAEGLEVTSEEGGAVGSAVTSMALVVRDYTGTLTGDLDGPLGPYQRWYLDGADWPVESAPDAARYVEFAVTAADATTLTLTDIDLVMNAGGTGELDASLFYDADPSFSAPTPLATDVDVSRDEVGTFSFDISEELAAGQTLYVRVYPWLGGGNPSSGRYLFLQDVTISGTSETVGGGEADGVFWSLSAADTTSVTSAAAGLGGAPVRSADVEVRDYTGDLRDAGDAVGPYGPFQRWWRGDGVEWPVETAIDPTRYVEFAAGADAGETFYVDGVSLYVHGDGTSEMRASVFAATTADFSDAVALEEDFNAGDGDFGGPTLREYDLDLSVPSGDSVYVRVYPYLGDGDPSVTRYLLLQAVTIEGSTDAAPPAAENVFWSLTASDTTSVTAAAPGLGGAMVRASDLEVRDYDGDLRDAGDAVGSLGPFQRWWRGGDDWPDEDAPDPNRYVEFVAGVSDPETALRVDSLSVYIHGDGTSAMRAQVAYSASPDFSAPVVLDEELEADDGDTAGAVILRSYAIDEVVGDSIYVRIYPWVRSSSVGSGRYLLLQAMTIYGEAVGGIATERAPESAGLVLHPAAPNPAGASTTLRYELAEAAEVEVAVVNVLGQRVATLASGPRPAGAHAMTVDASGLAAGTYFVRVRAGGEAQARPFVVVR